MGLCRGSMSLIVALLRINDGEKGLVASDLEIVRRNEQIGIVASGANNLDLIKSIPVNGAFTLNDLDNLISNGKRIVSAQISTRNSALH